MDNHKDDRIIHNQEVKKKQINSINWQVKIYHNLSVVNQHQELHQKIKYQTLWIRLNSNTLITAFSRQISVWTKEIRAWFKIRIHLSLYKNKVAPVEIEHLLGQPQVVMDLIDNNKEPSQTVKWALINKHNNITRQKSNSSGINNN